MRLIALIVASAIVSTPASGQASEKPEILVLGTFHMVNQGRNIHNMQTDDIFSPRRQQEMRALIDVLKRFRPTKIALEQPVGDPRVKQQYVDFVVGRYALTGNEVDQIGYRLAKELGHPAVYPVDEGGEFQFTRAHNYAVAKGMVPVFDSMEARVEVHVKREAEVLGSHTLLETLADMNADSAAAETMRSDIDFVQFGDPWEYAGSDLLAFWFQRNARIYRNIQALATAPGDRILVIYGAGHLPWLRSIAINDRRVRLRTLGEILDRRPSRDR